MQEIVLDGVRRLIINSFFACDHAPTLIVWIFFSARSTGDHTGRMQCGKQFGDCRVATAAS